MGNGKVAPSPRPTNNRAELQAVFAVLEHFHSSPIHLVVAMDSQYAYDGLKGSAFC